ncbi:MAG: flagellar basal body P-ring protein FlgI [Acetobacteraceae bacterium]|nr:flagellar basal body P-ring protein FlgI [Acetobacteraceae bacterium]
MPTFARRPAPSAGPKSRECAANSPEDAGTALATDRTETDRKSLTAPLLRNPIVALARFVLLAASVLAMVRPVAAQVRIKDIADVEGVRANQLVGYGLVVGLNGTGDKLDNAVFTRQSLIGMLERLGVNTRDQEAKLQTKNVAAVMVTADLPAFARSGSRIDVAISSLGDATNLTGGTLLVTPLLGADGEVYGVAQGALATGAIAARGAATSVTRGVPTSGTIANGATVEREVHFRLDQNQGMRLGLRNPDLTTARRIAEAINQALGGASARATDPRTVALEMNGRDPVEVLARIEDLRVEPDTPAVVVIDEASGTIVMGANVRISTVAIAQGNLTIRVTETPQVSQPGPLSNGTTTVVPRTEVQVDDQHDRKLGILRGSVTLRDLVASLNALGVGPRDLISILQAIKAAGALQADLQVR